MGKTRNVNSLNVAGITNTQSKYQLARVGMNCLRIQDSGKAAKGLIHYLTMHPGTIVVINKSDLAGYEISLINENDGKHHDYIAAADWINSADIKK